MNGDTEREIAASLAAWGKALVTNDASAIGRFAADDWVIVASQGVFTKADFLAAVQSGVLTHDTFEADVKDVRVYGDCAVVIAHVTNTGTMSGERFSSDEWTTDVYIRNNDGWLCVLTQLTPRVQQA